MYFDKTFRTVTHNDIDNISDLKLPAAWYAE